MPKLWSDTLETHRREVVDAILTATAALVSQHGLRSVTMSQIAEESRIGRATLYKYFPDVEAILVAWHERQLHAHLAHLEALADRSGPAAERLEAVLDAFALIQHEHRDHELTGLLHQGAHVQHAERHVRGLLQRLLTEGAKAHDIRSDVPPEELAAYCFHALRAAGSLSSKAAVRRLVLVALAGLAPPPTPPGRGSRAAKGGGAR